MGFQHHQQTVFGVVAICMLAGGGASAQESTERERRPSIQVTVEISQR